jgi:hypothetical protein
MSSSSGPNSQSSSWRAQKATAADLTLLEKLDLIPALLSVCMPLYSHKFLSFPTIPSNHFQIYSTLTIHLVANTITAIFTGAVRSKDVKPPSFYRYIVLTALRTLVRRTTVRQQQYAPCHHISQFHWLEIYLIRFGGKLFLRPDRRCLHHSL